MEIIIKALRLFHQQGLSVCQIAKQLNINRRTVTKYITSETLQPPRYQRNKQHHPA